MESESKRARARAQVSRRDVLAALFAAALAAAPATLLAHPDDAAETDRAKAVLAQIQAGKLDRSQLATSLNAALTDPILEVMTRQVADLGTPVRFGLRYAAENEGVRTYVYRIRWNNAVLDYTFGVDDAEKVAALYFRGGPPE